MKFELFVAVRYLKAKRKQAVISLITIISIVGVAAGVAALVIALAINRGFRDDLRMRLLGAQAHVQLLAREGRGIKDYLDVVRQASEVDGVIAAAPSVYQELLIQGVRTGVQTGVQLKGVMPEFETRVSQLADNIIEGSLDKFTDAEGVQPIVVGKELASSLGVRLGDRVRAISPETDIVPTGRVNRRQDFEVAAIFSSGLYEYDQKAVYVPIAAAQYLGGRPNMASHIEVKIRDADQAHVVGQAIVDAIGPERVAFTDWTVRYRSIFDALKMERVVMSLTIGLIVMVAALNIVSTLIMMVLEKGRDIAVLMSMGATNRNIRKIFIYQGVIIGVIGTIAGLILGNTISYFAEKYQLVSLPGEVYSISHVPFRPDVIDSVVIAASAVLISFLATLYPSASAARLQPVETLRYE